MELIAATRNRAKIEHLAALVGDLAVVVPLPVSAGNDQAPENEATIEANADAKAVYWSKRVDLAALVVATDGGLEIPAMGAQWDPTRTRRFAGEQATDVERADALLKLAANLVGDERKIAWREALSLAAAGTVIARWSATDDAGLLAESIDVKAIQAGNGFWIPSLWRSPDFNGRRLSELTLAEQRDRVDHWSVLGADLRTFLADYRRNRA